MQLNQLEEKLRSNFSEAIKLEMDRVKKELGMPGNEPSYLFLT